MKLRVLNFNMNPLVNLSLERIFSSPNSYFGSNAKFNNFELIDEKYSAAEGLNSSSLFGRVVYSVNGEIFYSSLILKMAAGHQPFPEFHMFNFTNEIFFYTQVLPFFSSMRNIEHIFPKFYGSQLVLNPGSQMEGIMVFENLQATDYFVSKQKSFLNYDHLVLMMRKLGEYHSYSYAAKQGENSMKFFALAQSFTEIFFPIIGKMHFTLPNTSLRGLIPLRNSGNNKYRQKVLELEQLFKDANNEVVRILTKGKENSLSVLCHGDYIRSNMLFKYNGTKPTDMKFIDMANCRLASPVTDIAMVLYFHADQKMRNDHWDDLIDVYCEEMKKTFPDVHMPTKSQIMEEFRGKSIIAYLIATYFLDTLIAADNELPINELLPHKKKIWQYTLLSEKEYLEFHKVVGNSIATEALGDILKDMIDRNFI